MAGSRAPRWQRLAHDQRRAQILACARHLFSQRTYASVSTSEIAREAGVARGLLNHYFGTKRELYLEVVRSLMRTPANPVPALAGDDRVETVINDSVERWLAMLERNPATWLAAVGAHGFGRDPEVEAILEDARERAAERLIGALERYRSAAAPPEVHAAIRAYSGFAEVASVEWLERRRLTREQLKVLLVQAFLSIAREVLPAVQHEGERAERSVRDAQAGRRWADAGA